MAPTPPKCYLLTCFIFFCVSVPRYLAVVAVIIGASPGDVAALTSIDIIAAAFLGLIFLGEKLNLMHFLALGLSLAGALCISQPEFLFGRPEGQHHSPLGCWLALLSGCFQAGSFVCARKSAHISVGVLTFSTLLLAVPMAFVISLLFHNESQESWEPVLAEPWVAIGLVVVISLWTMSAVALPAAGATRCPAAVSATVFTSACMISGYLAQIVFFKEMPQALTLLGAGCMLLSVVLMAIPSRKQEPQPEPKTCSSESVDAEARGASDESDAVVDETDETESLGSFVASEVSFRSTVRRRARHLPKATVLAARIGAAFPVVGMSA